MNNEVSLNLTTRQELSLKQIGQMIASGDDADAINSRWEKFMIEAVSSDPEMAIDIDAIVQYILRAAYQDASEDLYFYADKVKQYNAIKKEIRKYLSEIREVIAQIKVQKTSLEQELETLDDLSQEMNMALQNQLQKTQQFIQLLSNIQKRMHDTATEVIKNLK
jgi:iron-sulfur cluster repair protein YtfE (RIC family)